MPDDGYTDALLWNVAGRSELTLRDVAAGQDRRVTLPIDLASPRGFSRDGRTFAVSGASANRTVDVYVIAVASGVVRRVTESRHDGVDLAMLAHPELVTNAAPGGRPEAQWR